MSKAARHAARAIRHYITVLEEGRSHVTDEEAHFFDNDISMIRGLLPMLEAGRWPENWREMDSAPRDRTIRLGGNGWSAPGRWNGEDWNDDLGRTMPSEPRMWALIPMKITGMTE